jgi:hypothetical protein
MGMSFGHEPDRPDRAPAAPRAKKENAMHRSTYLFDNTAEQAGQRFASLETLFDPVTIGNPSATGVRAGWRCLEVGAGGGSVAGWLAARAGPEGHVLATDVNPRWLAPADLAHARTPPHSRVWGSGGWRREPAYRRLARMAHRGQTITNPVSGERLPVQLRPICRSRRRARH